MIGSRTRSIVTALALAAVIGMPSVAGAGEVNVGQADATPNPALVGDTVTVANVAGDTNTCEGGMVRIVILDPIGGVFRDDMVTPDAAGNWSTTFVPDQVGEWTVTPSCESADNPTAQPQAAPPFGYVGIFVQVQAPGTTASTAPSSTTSTTAAQAANVTPAFTG